MRVVAVAKRTRRASPSPELQAFAFRLRQAMTEAHYNPDQHGEQTRLADAAGVDQSQVSRGLAAQRHPGHQAVYRLALALGTSPAWLLWGHPPKRLTVAVEPASGATPEDLLELALDALRKQKSQL